MAGYKDATTGARVIELLTDNGQVMTAIEGANSTLGLTEVQQQGYLMAKSCLLTAGSSATAANLELVAERLIIFNATTTAGKYAWVKVNGTAVVPTAPAVGDGIIIAPGATVTVDVHSTPQAVVSGGGQVSCIRGSDADCSLYVIALGNSAS